MILRHPFEWLPVSVQKRALLGVFILTLVVLAGLLVLGAPLMTEEAPLSIISFQFAGELDSSHAILKSWGSKGQVFAGLGLGLDYLFLLTYSSCLSLGCVLLARSFSQRVTVVYVLGMVLSWVAFGAALFDALENYALIRILLGTQLELWPSVAFWCAVLKFLLFAISAGYLVFGYPALRIMTFRKG